MAKVAVRKSVTGNGLLTGLVAYYPLNEASGDTTELTRTVTLTAYNAPDSAAGKLYANARQFAATSHQYFRGTDTALQNLVGPLTLAAWQFPYTWSGGDGKGRMVLSNGPAYWVGGWDFRQNWSGETVVTLCQAGSLETMLFWHAGIATTPTLNQWNLSIITYDPITSAVVVNLNGGAVTAQTTWDYGPLTAGLADKVTIGNIASDALDQWYDGRLGPIMAWNKVLSVGEISALWNGGNGLSYVGFTL